MVAKLGPEIEQHLGPLRRYARSLRRDDSDADDLVQDSVTRALSFQDRFQPGTNLRAWLMTIMHNLHANQVRRRIAQPDGHVLYDSDIRMSGPGGQDGRMIMRDLQRAMATLPAEQRQVLLLIALEGLKYDEVAVIMDIPVGTVMSRLSRARETLRRRLSGEQPMLRRVK